MCLLDHLDVASDYRDALALHDVVHSGGTPRTGRLQPHGHSSHPTPPGTTTGSSGMETIPCPVGVGTGGRGLRWTVVECLTLRLAPLTGEVTVVVVEAEAGEEGPALVARV